MKAELTEWIYKGENSRCMSERVLKKIALVSEWVSEYLKSYMR